MNFLIKRLLYLIDFCQRWKTRIFKDEIIEKKLLNETKVGENCDKLTLVIYDLTSGL